MVWGRGWFGRDVRTPKREATLGEEKNIIHAAGKSSLTKGGNNCSKGRRILIVAGVRFGTSDALRSYQIQWGGKETSR